MSAFRPDGWTTPELAQAVERGQLELHYQPVVDLRSGGIVGAEALLRWRHPTLGLLPPGQFLPVVESSGLMPEIGAWVLGEACRQMRDWRMLAWRPFRLAVNVSASQVGPDFDGWVKGVLADAELPAEYLEIELTESVAFGDPAIFPALDALRQIGVRFAADDFGTGYSCLQHLKCCPISTLKIDQSFVAGLANDRRDQTIVHTVIQLAHGLGMDVVAEGVETSASLDLLRQADCDTGQGFLFAKPMPAAAFAVFVSQWRGATMNASDSTTTSCCVCCKEIPLDAAFTPEGAEYVEHFCGWSVINASEAQAHQLRPRPASTRTQNGSSNRSRWIKCSPTRRRARTHGGPNWNGCSPSCAKATRSWCTAWIVWRATSTTCAAWCRASPSAAYASSSLRSI
jgi:EAL domain-containing protein (putative c-di-GMP-specific phosphodiesterase class I)